MRLWTVPAVLLAFQILGFSQTISPGTQIQVATGQPLALAPRDREAIFPARVTFAVYAKDWGVAIPKGAEAQVIVRESEPGQLTVELESVTVNGTVYLLNAADQGYTMMGGRNAMQTLLPAAATITFEVQEPLSLEPAEPVSESGSA